MSLNGLRDFYSSGGSLRGTRGAAQAQSWASKVSKPRDMLRNLKGGNNHGDGQTILELAPRLRRTASSYFIVDWFV